MEELFKSIGITIINILEILGSSTIELIKNPVFLLIIGVAILYIVINITMTMIKKRKKEKVTSKEYPKLNWSYEQKRKHLGLK